MRAHETYTLARPVKVPWVGYGLFWLSIMGPLTLALWMMNQRLKAVEVRPVAKLYWSCPSLDRFGPSCLVGPGPVPGWYSGIVAPDLDVK